MLAVFLGLKGRELVQRGLSSAPAEALVGLNLGVISAVLCVALIFGGLAFNAIA